MTLEELAELVNTTREGCNVIFYSFRAAKAGGGVPFQRKILLPERSGGRYHHDECIFLDSDAPPIESASIWFHEMGHREYAWNTPRRKWDNFESELAAMTNELRETMGRGLTDSLRHSMTNFENGLTKDQKDFPTYVVEAVRALSKTEVWRDAKQYLEKHQSIFP